MAGKATTFASEFLELIFNAVPIPGLADDAAMDTVTDLEVALHTSSPGAGGDQSTNEISYTGYARVVVARDNTGWTVTDNVVSPAADIVFGTMTGGAGGTVTHMSVGTGETNRMLLFGTVTPNIVVANGVTPRLTTDTTITEI